MRTLFACCLLFLAVIAVLDLPELAAATYRKPPFNGSIFGKRGSTTDYEASGKTLSSLCEIASEACGTWFSLQENK